MLNIMTCIIHYIVILACPNRIDLIICLHLRFINSEAVAAKGYIRVRLHIQAAKLLRYFVYRSRGIFSYERVNESKCQYVVPSVYDVAKRPDACQLKVA